MYKFNHNDLPSPLLNMYAQNNLIHEHNTRNQLDYRVPSLKVDIAHRSFIYQAPIMWSILPENLKSSRTIKHFGSQIKTFYISIYE